MRLTSEEARGLYHCLAALKRQRQALASRIDDVKNLLGSLEAADDAAASAAGAEPLRTFQREPQPSASASL
jgi:hypothetical protein